MLAKEANLLFHSRGQLLKERICSLRSKFFPLRVDPIAKSYCMLCGHCQFAPYNIGQQNTVHFHHIFSILFGQRNQYFLKKQKKKNYQLNLIIRQDTAMGVLLYLKRGNCEAKRLNF